MNLDNWLYLLFGVGIGAMGVVLGALGLGWLLMLKDGQLK